MRVVCAGHVNWDVTLSVDRLPAPDDEARVRERFESGGGSAANAAVALAALSLDVRLLGSVGHDEAGQRALEAIRERGVETEVDVVDDEPTTRKYVLVDDDGEVAVVGRDGANEALGPEDVSPADLDGADALHLTGQRPDTAARLAKHAVDRDVPVCFDPGRRLGDRDFGPVLRLADVVFATDREAEGVDLEAPWQVTKHGSEGATLVCPDDTLEHPGYGLPSVDSTGAGDAFAAGFVASWLEDRDPERALAVANACGAIAASERGPRPDLSWERVEAVLGEE
jgi:ribokinase